MRQEEDVEKEEHDNWMASLRGKDEETGETKPDWKAVEYELSDHSAPGSEDEEWDAMALTESGYSFASIDKSTGKARSSRAKSEDDDEDIDDDESDLEDELDADGKSTGKRSSRSSGKSAMSSGKKK